MQLQKAVPNIIPVFDLDACITGRGVVSQPYVYVAAKETPVARFAAKTLLEKALREVDEHGAFPPLNWPGFEWQRGPTMVQRDRLFENGYSLLHLRPGYGPVVHWGTVGDSRVFLMDLVCIGTILKTWIHYFRQEAQPRFASICMQYPADAAYHIWRNEIQDLSRQVYMAARSARMLYGKDPLFIHDEDGDFTMMVWRSPGHEYKLKFVHSNFDIKIQVGPELWFAFNNCFGPDTLYHLTTDFTEV
uniref:Uncharacterized protein n=1 Tax=Pseudomonas phage HRDY3 TaxID=3236930 RepID=A0AB39CDL4_9VIRU